MKKILIVDDDPSILESIQLLLEGEGYLVETLPDSKNIFQKALGKDLLLLDVWLPFKNGTEVARDLKSAKETENIPIILISGVRELGKLTLESKADGFLEKPFDIDHLLSIIKKYTKVETKTAANN